MRVGLLYEHPTWSRELIARARARPDVDLTAIDVGAGDPRTRFPDGFDLWINRVNAMPSPGRPASVVAATGHLLLSLELAGERVVNGSMSHRIGASKAAQAALFAAVGIATPAGITIHRVTDALGAAAELGYPVLTKPNVGGSGSGIVRHDSEDELRAAIDADAVDLGIDGTGLVQRVIESTGSTGGFVHRVEMLGSAFFYGTRQAQQPNSFNYCAADGCSVDGAGQIELFTPDDEVVEQAAAVMAAAETDVGGVEYLIDRATGKPSFYDFNPYSNFVTGFDDELGFDPIERYLDFVLASTRTDRTPRLVAP